MKRIHPEQELHSMARRRRNTTPTWAAALHEVRIEDRTAAKKPSEAPRVEPGDILESFRGKACFHCGRPLREGVTPHGLENPRLALHVVIGFCDDACADAGHADVTLLFKKLAAVFTRSYLVNPGD
jgi:hypothetical protein